eukprot:3867764-Amphidinium_carterae.1
MIRYTHTYAEIHELPKPKSDVNSGKEQTTGVVPALTRAVLELIVPCAKVGASGSFYGGKLQLGVYTAAHAARTVLGIQV